jgi:hypothetical protein
MRCRGRTAQAFLDRAGQAAPGDMAAGQHRRMALTLYGGRLGNTRQINDSSSTMASRGPKLSMRFFPSAQIGRQPFLIFFSFFLLTGAHPTH